MFLGIAVDNTDIFNNILIVDGNLHALTAQYIGRTNQHRITQLVGSVQSLIYRKYGTSGSTLDTGLGQNLVKQFTIFCGIYVRGIGTQNLHTHLDQCFCQLDSCLATELHNSTVRFLNINYIFHIFRSQRLEIQLVGNIEVGTYGLRVVVHDNSLIAFLRESPGTVHGAEVKLDTLSDTDRAGTKNQYLFAVMSALCLIFSAIYGIIVRCGRSKLGGAGIYHLISSGDTPVHTHLLDLLGSLTCQISDHVIREFHTFGFTQQILCQLFALEILLHFHQNGDLVDEPQINAGDLMDRLVGDTLANSLGDSPDTHIIYDFQLLCQFFHGQGGEIVGHQAVHMLFQRTDSLHQGTLEVVADTHNLAGSFHLCGQGTFGTDKLIKGQTRDLDYTVVQHGFKAGVGLSGDGIGNLIQGVTQSNLGCNLGDGITGSLGSQCGRTAYTGVDLDNTVFKAVRMQGILYVTAAGDAQLADDVQRRGTQHLVLFIAQRLGRSHNDTVTGMHTHRVNIFHITNGNAVACTVTHNLVLDLFPAGDAALYQYLSHTGKAQTILQDFFHFHRIVGDTAAAAAQSIGRTKYDRITDFFCESQTILHALYHERRSHRLTDLFHGALKFKTVFCLFDRLGCGTDQTHIVLF